MDGIRIFSRIQKDKRHLLARRNCGLSTTPGWSCPPPSQLVTMMSRGTTTPRRIQWRGTHDPSSFQKRNPTILPHRAQARLQPVWGPHVLGDVMDPSPPTFSPQINSPHLTGCVHASDSTAPRPQAGRVFALLPQPLTAVQPTRYFHVKTMASPGDSAVASENPGLLHVAPSYPSLPCSSKAAVEVSLTVRQTSLLPSPSQLPSVTLTAPRRVSESGPGRHTEALDVSKFPRWRFHPRHILFPCHHPLFRLVRSRLFLVKPRIYRGCLWVALELGIG